MTVTEKRTKKGRRYRVEVYVAGVRVAQRYCATKSEAHTWHDETKRRYESGRAPTDQMRFREVLDLYKARELPTAATSTKRRFGMLAGFVERAPLAATPMGELDVRAIDRFLDWALEQPEAKTKARHSFVKELRLVTQLCRYFRDHLDERYAPPVMKRHYKRARFKKVTPRRKDYFVRAEEIGPFLAQLAAMPDPVYAEIAIFQLVMGLRIGETAALAWDKVDLWERELWDHAEQLAGFVKVERTMDWHDAEGKRVRTPDDRVKTPESLRTLPIPPLVAELLTGIKERGRYPGVVFANKKGLAVDDGTVRDNYERAFVRAKLPWPGSTHLLRHTNATLGAIGGDLAAVMVNLGHASLEQAQEYAKLHAITKNTVPARLAALMPNHAKNHAVH